MGRPIDEFYEFDDFRADPLKRVLLKADSPVHLTPKAFDILIALIERKGQVVDKDELLKVVWDGAAIEENNLARNISSLRKALGETPSAHRYIVTVPGRGYSFVAAVEVVPTNGVQSAADKQNWNGSALHSETDYSAKPNGLERGAQLGPSAQTVGATTTDELFGLLSTTGKRNRRLLATALILLSACAGLLAFKSFNTHSKPAALNSYRDWDVVRLTRNGGSIIPAISRDGKYVAYVNKESGQESIWILQLATSARQQIVPPEKFFYFDLLFTPDSSELYFARREGAAPQRALYRIPMLGGIAKKLRDDVDSLVTLSPDGAHLGFARRNPEGKSEFIIANADGAEERVLVRHRLEFPAWSPDGNAIAYSVGDASSGAENMGIHVVRLDDGSEKFTPRKWNHVGHKSWLPDASGLIIVARESKSNVNGLWLVAYPSGEARQLSGELDDFHSIRLAEDAQVVVAEEIVSVSDIWSAPLADAAGAKKIGVWGRSGLCLDTHGRVVYSSLQSGEYSKIWLMNADGTGPKQLTIDSGNDNTPVVSPDGRYLVFASNRSGNYEIWRMNLDGSNLVQLTNSRGGNAPSVSPDSRWVIYLSSGDSNLYKVPIDGGEPQRVVGNAVGVSAVSPGGKLIAYFARGKDAWVVGVSSFEDGSAIRRFEIGSHSLNNRALKWTPDGKALLYAASTDGVGNIWMQPLEGGTPKRVTDFKADGIFHFDVSSDGRDLVCARGGWKHDIVLIKNLR